MKKLFTAIFTFGALLFFASSAHAACDGVPAVCPQRITSNMVDATTNASGATIGLNGNAPGELQRQNFCLRVINQASGTVVETKDMPGVGSTQINLTESGTYRADILTDSPGNPTTIICNQSPMFIDFTAPTATLAPNETPPPGTTTTPAPEEGRPDCEAGETWVETFKGCYSFGGFINTSLEWLMIAAALLALFRFTVGGIQYIFSQGQPDKLESAQQTITSAVFGLVLVFIAWVLIQFVGGNTPDWWDINFFSITSP